MLRIQLPRLPLKISRMTGHQHDERRHIAVITLGVTTAFGLAALGGQMLFRSQFGPASGATASQEETATVTRPDVGQPIAALSVHLTTAAGTASDQALAAVDDAADGLKKNLEAQVAAKADEIKADAKAAAAEEARDQWQALQEKATDLAAPAADALEEAASNGGEDEPDAVGEVNVSEQDKAAVELTDKQKAAAEEAGREAWGLWRSLWEALKRIFQGIANALHRRG